MPNPWYGTDDTCLHLMEFIAEKVKDVECRANQHNLCKEYKGANNSNVSVVRLTKKLNKHRHEIHLMNEFDTPTKVKMMFALCSSVDEQFLQKLQREATVEVDYYNRITYYQKHDGSLELRLRKGRKTQTNSKQSPSSQQKAAPRASSKDARILRHLAEMSIQTTVPFNDSDFIEAYRLKYRDSDEPDEILARYRKIKKSIGTSNLHDNEIKVQMLFASNATVDGSLLNELQTNATVLLDQEGKIIEYRANDGSLTLGTAQQTVLPPVPNAPDSQDAPPVLGQMVKHEVREEHTENILDQRLYLIDLPDNSVANDAPNINITPANVSEDAGNSRALVRVDSALQKFSVPAAHSGADAREFWMKYQTIITLLPGGQYAQAKEVIKWLNYLILVINAPQIFGELKEKIERAIVDCGTESRVVPMEGLLTNLGPALLVISKSATPHSPEGSIQIRGFLDHFTRALHNYFSSPASFNFQVALQRIHADYGHNYFPVENIRSILETLLTWAF